MKRRKKPTMPYPTDRGTPATRRKQRQPTVANGVRRGWITPPMEMAAAEIESVFQTLYGNPMGMRVSSLERVDGGGDAPLPAKLTEAYVERYAPWARWMGAARWPIIDLVVHNFALWEIEEKHQESEGWAKDCLIFGLEFYDERTRIWKSHKEQLKNSG